MTVREWIETILQIAVQLAVLVPLALRFIRAPLEAKIQAHQEGMAEKMRIQGGRLGAIEGSVSEQRGRMEELQRQDQRHSFEIAALTEKFGKLDGMLERIDNNTRTISGERAEEASEIKERLARIEARMDIFDQLADALRIIAKRSLA